MVLGQISQIGRYDVSLSLPNNLTGYVPLTSMSNKLSHAVEASAAKDDESIDENGAPLEADIDLRSYFKIGQYLRAYVVSTHSETETAGKGRRHIELSIHPSQANLGLQSSDVLVNSMVQASVTSVEDHGLIMDVGLMDKAVKGFISSKELGADVEYHKVKKGAVYLTLVTGLSSSGKIIKLSADPSKIGNIKKTHYLKDAATVNSFLPGTAVEVLLTNVNPSGIAGKVMGVLDVTADLVHSGAASSGKALEKKYSTGSKIKGRIICNFPTASEKKLGISLLDHVLTLTCANTSDLEKITAATEILPVSSFVEEARICKVEPTVGLLMDLGVKGLRGFAHISQISDKRVDNLSETTGAYKVGSTHRARVIGFNSMDALYLVSLQRSILDKNFLRIEDVQVGQLVTGTIEKLMINASGFAGVIIKIAEGITGLAPEIHLADVHLQHPDRRFKEGASVKARVLSTDLQKRQIRLTLKKSLVNSDVAIWKSHDHLQAGMQSPGTIISILSAGAVVQFYGAVRGFLPVSEMSESYIQDPQQHFRVGQVVNVHIISVDKDARRMIVSCRDMSEFGVSQQEALSKLQPGAMVSGTVSEKNAKELVVELAGSKLKGILPIEHLADGSAQKAISVSKLIRVDQNLKQLLVLSKQENRRTIRLSSKPSLVQAAKAGSLVKSFEDVNEGAEVVGYVENVTLIGAFVEFVGGVKSLLLKKHMPDEAIRLPDFGLRKDQSIVAKVLSVNHGQQNFLLTQKDLPAKETSRAIDKAASFMLDKELTNAADGVTTSIDDFSLGKLTKAKIVSVKDTQMNVQLADGVQGRIDVSEVFDTWEDIKDRKHPLKAFSTKQVLPVRILGVHDSRNHRFLPITNTGKSPVFELSAKRQTQNHDTVDVLMLNKVEKGSSWIVFVNNVAEDCLWVNLSPNVRGRIRSMEVSDDVSLLSDLEKNFPVGSALRAHVLDVDVLNNRLDLSARSGSKTAPLSLADLSKGMVLPGRVTKVTERNIVVQLSETLSAPVNLVDLADDYSTANPTTYHKNQIVRVCVTGLDIPNKRISLTTRSSKVLSSSLPVQDREISSAMDLSINDVVRGFIKNVADNGIFISLASNVTAFVRISDLSDAYIKDWKSDFQVDQLVKGKVIALDTVLNHIQMSLKHTVIDNEDYHPPLTYSDIKLGQVVTGKIRKVEDFGVFIDVDNSAHVSGLCHKSEVAETRVADVRGLYELGDSVKAKVLKYDPEKRKLSFGLKASYFEDAMLEDNNESSEDIEDDMDGVELPGHVSEGQAVISEGGSSIEDDVEFEIRNEIKRPNSRLGADAAANGAGSKHEPMTINSSDPRASKEFKGLSTGGFDWTGGMMDEDAEESQSVKEGGAEEPRKKKKKRKRPEIQEDITGDLDAHGPQSVADFERLLLGQPNSSYLWLSYMALQLQLNEVTKARDIAERAIRTIDMREETDKMNVWVGLLNLENTYGSDESVDAIFKRACEYNDAQDIHERLTSIYIQSGKNNVSSWNSKMLFRSLTAI